MNLKKGAKTQMIDMIKNKNQSKQKGRYDVTISIGKSINARRITFSFSNKARKKVFKTYSYATFGFIKNNFYERCYFEKSNTFEGFKIAARANNNTSYFATKIDERFSGVSIDEWAGHYSLSFDEKEKKYYIQLEEREG